MFVRYGGSDYVSDPSAKLLQPVLSQRYHRVRKIRCARAITGSKSRPRCERIATRPTYPTSPCTKPISTRTHRHTDTHHNNPSGIWRSVSFRMGGGGLVWCCTAGEFDMCGRPPARVCMDVAIRISEILRCEAIVVCDSVFRVRLRVCRMYLCARSQSMYDVCTISERSAHERCTFYACAHTHTQGGHDAAMPNPRYRRGRITRVYVYEDCALWPKLVCSPLSPTRDTHTFIANAVCVCVLTGARDLQFWHSLSRRTPAFVHTHARRMRHTRWGEIPSDSCTHARC